jgi:hypothetical protein
MSHAKFATDGFRWKIQSHRKLHGIVQRLAEQVAL